MEAKLDDLARKYVYGVGNDAITDTQEMRDLKADIQKYAEEYHNAKLEYVLKGVYDDGYTKGRAEGYDDGYDDGGRDGYGEGISDAINEPR